MRQSQPNDRSFLLEAAAISVFSLIFGVPTSALAVEPSAGQVLFEKPFSVPGIRPFNSNSCVKCHRMGGVGGAGEPQFNARSIAIEAIRIPAGASDAEVSRFVSFFYPNLVGSDGSVSTVSPVPHFGGNSAEHARRAELMRQLSGLSSPDGGPATQADLESELKSEVRFDLGHFSLAAKSFHRNTPALFGAGLIDSITDEQIEHQANLQRQLTSVSGRPATLNGGGIGRFGWRANLATLEEFTRQACENEIGLRVAANPPIELEPPAEGFKPVPRPRSTSDISIRELRSMTAFLKSLPAPRPIRPTDPHQLEQVVQGEQLFNEIGCAICHVQTIGPAENLYSDLLLHDMGESLRGPSTADPYIYSSTEIDLQPTVVAIRTSGYSGGSVSLSQSMGSGSSSSSRKPRTLLRPYQARPESIQFFTVASQDFVSHGQSNRTSFRRQTTVRQTKVRRNRIRSTNVSQEWRTPPLWGLRDSAPYMHDGRAATVEAAIQMHDGEGQASRRRYQLLTTREQAAVLAFLDTFAAPVDAPQPSRYADHEVE